MIIIIQRMTWKTCFVKPVRTGRCDDRDSVVGRVVIRGSLVDGNVMRNHVAVVQQECSNPATGHGPVAAILLTVRLLTTGEVAEKTSSRPGPKDQAARTRRSDRPWAFHSSAGCW